ncbi:hypothetical protein RAMLITH_06075 [Ramlibacter sp. RBP-2]|uniref:Uncharacterized protein n=1 Tax=Ramlibacter lithotrophicus TaxID=2606681 RepID=A0A7X6DDW7_9BURK|nr:hypothetical protein [Ramlibacter lithotrophicus]
MAPLLQSARTLPTGLAAEPHRSSRLRHAAPAGRVGASIQDRQGRTWQRLTTAHGSAPATAASPARDSRRPRPSPRWRGAAT